VLKPLFLVLYGLPAGIAVSSSYQIKRQLVKAILTLELFVQVPKQLIIQVDGGMAMAADKVVMRLTSHCFIVRLFAEKVIFPHETQFAQQFQCAVDGGEADIGITLLNAFSDLIYAEMLIGLLDDTQDHMALRC
jgi:hypothetical protein